MMTEIEYFQNRVTQLEQEVSGLKAERKSLRHKVEELQSEVETLGDELAGMIWDRDAWKAGAERRAAKAPEERIDPEIGVVFATETTERTPLVDLPGEFTLSNGDKIVRDDGCYVIVSRDGLFRQWLYPEALVALRGLPLPSSYVVKK